MASTTHRQHALDPAAAAEATGLMRAAMILMRARGTPITREDAERIQSVLDALDAFKRGNVIITPEQP